MKIGFIGLGMLGTPLAENISDSGHELYVYNRTVAKTKALAEKGAKVCNSIEELAIECKVVFTMVSDDAALKEVSEELVKHLSPGSLQISMSTVLAQTAAELDEKHIQKGLQYVAAPVFGRPEHARARKMNFVLSGNAAARKQAEPLCKDAGATGVWDFGDDIRTANTIKLCGNFITAAAMEAIGESIALAQRSGVDAGKMWELFGTTMHNSPTYNLYSRIIAEQKFEPASFTIKLGLKDMDLVLQQAKAAGQSMPLAELLQKNMLKVVNEGKDQLDWSAVSQAVN
jgi:3-hydroxyisobutyrate dehydrogenase-like beta-hydroxyacid dehydrogenase